MGSESMGFVGRMAGMVFKRLKAKIRPKENVVGWRLKVGAFG